MKTALDPRHTTRQDAVQSLFAWAFHKQSLANQLAKDVVKNITLIDDITTQSAPEFTIDRINHIDLAILRLAIYELVVLHKEPPKVIIDEAVELAKEFGGDTSPAFINGALGKVFSSPARINRIIADTLGVEDKNLTDDANLRTDLNADDIEVADLLEKLEIDKGTSINTVRDILDYVEDHTI